MLDLENLLNNLELVELKFQQESSDPWQLDQLITVSGKIKIKMYCEGRHPRPHFHVDYGKENHSASFAIDTGEKLVGDLPNRYYDVIKNWTQVNRDKLLSIWQKLQAGNFEKEYIQELSRV